MIVQVLGATLVMSGATGLGFAAARRFRQRPQELQTLGAGLRMLATEIEYAATPLATALARVSDRLTGPVASLFADAAQRVAQSEGNSVADCFAAAIETQGSRLSLKKSDAGLLLQFGQTLGLSSRDDQISHIQMTCLQLETERASALDERARNERLCRYVGILSGLLIVILLI